MTMTKILVADDETSIRTILASAMTKKGFEILRAQTGDQALEILRSEPVDVAIIDIRMPGISGLELLNHHDEFPGKPAIFVITAQDTMENAVEAMKRGAYDYLTKPFDLEELSILVDRALDTRSLQQEVQLLRQQSGKPSNAASIVGKSKSILEIYKIIGKVANQDVTVLIKGESGTGKELVAQAIHYQGRRAAHPFVAVNCSAIPGELLESELFGYRKGAFTGAALDKIGYFERAHTGTLFLDEIGDMPLPLQAKLLRVLQEKEIQRLGDTRSIPIDVRIIAATNRNLEAKVREGSFREDLYFRLNVVPIALPPLRERRTDILLLVRHFMEQFSSEIGVPAKQVTEEAADYLKHLDWPGNVRELENLLKRVFVLTQGPVLELRDFKSLASNYLHGGVSQALNEEGLEAAIAQGLESSVLQISSDEADLYNRFIPLVERPLIQLALKRTKGNQLKAARLLGINRNTLRKRIRELKIPLRTLEEVK
jgi:two-component system nitrogen regulation response regulator GlnG